MQSTTRDERRLLVASMAPGIGGLGAFTLAAVTTPFGLDRVVLCGLVLLVAATGIAGGRAAGLLAAAMSACSFDFFHVAPLRVLHVRTLAEAAAAFAAVALVTGRQAWARSV